LVSLAVRLSGRVDCQPAVAQWPSAKAPESATDYYYQTGDQMSQRYLTLAALNELLPKLTKSDLAIVKCVSELRFVSGAQLTRLHFSGADKPSVNAANARAARRILLRLVRLGVLNRLPRSVGGVRAGSAGFVYYLGLAGQRLATSYGWQPERRPRRSQAPGTLFVRHSLQVAELHTRLIEFDRRQRIELLELTAEPACWRTYGGSGNLRQVLKPDSYLRLGVGDYEDSYFIEVDQGTEGSRALGGQLQRYLDYYASGKEQATRGVFPKTLWLAPSGQRVSVIADCIGRLPQAGQGLFQVARFEEALATLTGPNPGLSI
jgi:Replication-relaxation